ncbi:MAG: hypothetical protein M1820_003975 [Bogoriella megaspora]|nr:MAG: hypothetical protein M1820_003975 [Bogoriella megaspora]
MPHIEVIPTTSTSAAPGWAYVPDTGYDPSKAAINPTARKRVARAPAGNTSQNTTNELTARQQTAINRHLAELDRDNSKDVHISVPTRKDEKRGNRGKMTPGVKRILTSQKTFANHLADEEAAMAMQPPRQPAAAAAGRAGRQSLDKGGVGRPVMDKGRRASGKGKRGSIVSQTSEGAVPTSSTAVEATADIEMVDAPPAQQDNGVQEEILDPLLQTSVPKPPTAQELEDLLSQPPLSYLAARAGSPPANAPPQRHFCGICGYWGRVKCMKCGGRICGLECKAAHDESRCVKFFA